jgi:hypothetical protein
MLWRKLLAGWLFLTGIIFFLQGINVLPGSFMTGDPRWAGVGVLAVVAGLLIWPGRAPRG